MCKVFDPISHNILVSQLKRHGFERWTTVVKEFGCIQRILVNSLMSMWRPVTTAIPQGSLLRLVLFNIFFSKVDTPQICWSESRREMIKGLEHISYEGRLGKLGCLALRKGFRVTLYHLPIPKLGLQESWRWTFIRACSDRTREKDFKLKRVDLD